MKSPFTLFLILFLAATPLFAWEYGGFSVDDSRLSISNQYVVSTTIMGQIDVINALPISPEVLDFFHRVPIVLIDDANSDYSGHYYDGLKKLKETDPRLWSSIPLKNVVINITSLVKMFSDKHFSDSALLYPLLWAFADQYLPQGYDTDELFTYAQEADKSNFYKYNWEDNYDQYGAAFFADTATAYLFEHSDAPPYQREAIAKKQPEYYSYLQKLFGPKSASYSPPISWRESVESVPGEVVKAVRENYYIRSATENHYVKLVEKHWHLGQELFK